jgi:hypothetical protein
MEKLQANFAAKKREKVENPKKPICIEFSLVMGSLYRLRRLLVTFEFSPMYSDTCVDPLLLLGRGYVIEQISTHVLRDTCK